MTQYFLLNPTHTNSEINDIIQSKGGLFTLEVCDSNSFIISLLTSIENQFKYNCAIAAQDLYTDRPRPISFSLIDSSRINAFAYADQTGAFDFIGVNYGIIYTLYNTFTKLLSHPEFLPDVGNAAGEIAERSYIPYLVTDLIGSDIKRSWVSPNCSMRLNFAGNMLQVAIDFLFFHEIAHLRSGHLEWLRQVYTKNRTEDGEDRPSATSNLELQALEMDADCGATLHILNKYINMHRIFRSRTTIPHRDELIFSFGSPYNTVRMLYISIYILFRIFDFKQWDMFNQYDKTHPEVLIRQSWITPTIYEIFRIEPLFEYDAMEFTNHAADHIISCETGIANILNQTVDMRGIESTIYSLSAKQYLNDVKSAWSRIRDQLEPFKRGGILPT